MTYTVDDKSIQDSKPRNLLKITQSSNVIYFMTSGEQDISLNGIVYTAMSMQIGEIGPANTTGETSLKITLPLTHPLCQRFVALGIPPQNILAEMWRMQLRSGEIKKRWTGSISTMEVSGETGVFTAPSNLQKKIKRRLPVISVSRLCPFTLYDSNCTVNRNFFTVPTTVVGINGRILRLTTQAAFGDNSFALYGEIVHLASGERSTVIEEGAIAFDGTTTFTMQVPIPEIQVGDTVQVVAGCMKDTTSCNNKFANFQNFGGFADLPPMSVSSPTGPNLFYYEWD